MRLAHDTIHLEPGDLRRIRQRPSRLARLLRSLRLLLLSRHAR